MRYVPFIWFLLPCFAVAQTETDGLTLLYQADTLVADSLGAAFGPEAQQAEVFFVGESHGFYDNQAVQFELLKYLHKYQGVREVCIENSVLDEWHFNRFVLEGDSAALKKSSVGRWVGTDKEALLFIGFLRKLRIYNAKLPISEKVVVRCLDLDLKIGDRKYALAQLLAEITKQPSREWSLMVRGAFTEQDSVRTVSEELFEELRSRLLSFDLTAAQENYALRCLECFRVTWEIGGAGGTFVLWETIMNLRGEYGRDKREEHLFSTFLASRERERKKALCVLGKGHTRHRDETGFVPFAQKLRDMDVRLFTLELLYLDRRIKNPFSAKEPVQVEGWLSMDHRLRAGPLGEAIRANVLSKYTFMKIGTGAYPLDTDLLLILKEACGVY